MSRERSRRRRKRRSAAARPWAANRRESGRRCWSRPAIPINRWPRRQPAAVVAGRVLENRPAPKAKAHRSGLRKLYDRRGLRLRRRGGLAADLLAVDRQAPLRSAELDRGAISQLAGEQHLRQRVLYPFLDHALQRARAIGRVVPLVGQPLPRLGIEAEPDLAILE